MDIHQRSHAAFQHSYYNNAEHAQHQSRATDSSAQHPPTSIDQEQLQQYVQNTLKKNQSLQSATQELNLQYSMPFDSGDYQKLMYQKFPEVLEATPPEERHEGICLGLSMVWLKQRLEGKSDSDFHQSILNPEHDAALLQAMGIQHVEQNAALQSLGAQHGATVAPNAISEAVAPKLGMNTVPVSKTQTSQTIPITPLPHFAASMGAACQQQRPQQGMLLLTSGHAMALMRDNDDQLHFFNPDCGVISSSAENRMCLYATMSDMIERLPSAQDNTVYVTEVQTTPKPVEPHQPLHIMNLLT